GPTSGKTPPNLAPYTPPPPVYQRPPWSVAPPAVIIHPVTPLNPLGAAPPSYQPFPPITGQPIGAVTGGVYRPSFGTPYPYTPPHPGAITPIVPSAAPHGTVPTVAPTESSHTTEVTVTTTMTEETPSSTSTEQVFIPVGTETRTSTGTTKAISGSTVTTESPLETSSIWIDERSHEAFRNDCSEREIERVRELHSHETECPCGPGMTRRGGVDEPCQEASTSSVIVHVVRLCDADQILSNDDRALVTLREILLDVVCSGTCTLDQMTYDYAKSPESRTGRTLLFEELSGGACSSDSLHNCEKPAECVINGLQWHCRCPHGYNDTSDGRGRECEWGGGGMEIHCIQVLGICLIWWFFILLLSILFLLCLCCLAWYLATRHCCKERFAAETGYTQTRIKVPRNVKIRPAEGDLPHVKNLMVKNAKGSALRGTTIALAQSKSLTTSSKRKSNLVLPAGSEIGVSPKAAIDVVSSDEENMGVPKSSSTHQLTIDSPAIETGSLPSPQIDVIPATPQRSESIVSMREIAGTPPTAPTPPPAVLPVAFAAAQAGSVPILTAKPPTPPSSKKSVAGGRIDNDYIYF
ncbi:hypothetical protein PFISCL1PPCAC_27952, partial [Pristionchus fissidentatus]